MKVIGFNYNRWYTGSDTEQRNCQYFLLGPDEIQPGDYIIHNDGLAWAHGVFSIEDYKPSHPNFAADKLGTIKHWSSRAEERELERKNSRVAEIQRKLKQIKLDHEKRLTLEAQAEAGGEEGKALLAELDKLEKEVEAAQPTA